MINFDVFLKWAEDRFGSVVIKGDEIMVNSIFAEDYKHHLSCNVFGGKHKTKHGVYRCWKSGKTGSLVSLVRLVDKCNFDEALETLESYDDLSDLEKRVEDLLTWKPPTPVAAVQPAEVGLQFPSGTFPIASLPVDNFWRMRAESYLLDRCLPIDDFLICTDDVDYGNRIIIPYYDQNKKLIYWNGRYIGESEKVAKYRGPNKNVGIGKGDVIYMAGEWPSEGTKLYLTEGEFNAKSIKICGLEAGGFGGKVMSEKQLVYIAPYLPILCLDTDPNKKKDYGGAALMDIGDHLVSHGFPVRYVRPPRQYKDWNKMLEVVGPRVLRAYIEKYEKPYNHQTRLELELRKI